MYNCQEKHAENRTRGVLIPKQLVEGFDEVEIVKQDGVIVVMPLPLDDPIHQLGKSPVPVEEHDAAENHDHYLYGQ